MSWLANSTLRVCATEMGDASRFVKTDDVADDHRHLTAPQASRRHLGAVESEDLNARSIHVGQVPRLVLEINFVELLGGFPRKLYEPEHVESENMESCKQTIASSDADLLHRVLAGDEAAFLVLYNRLKEGIFRYAFYMTNSKSAAEEVTQEAFMALLKEGHKYRAENGDVGAFAFGIARNFIRRIERRERAYQPFPVNRPVESLAKSLISESDVLSGQMIRGEVVERVQAAVASLPDHYRQVVVLCDLCELSYAEAAGRLGCAVGTIRSRLNRAHALLAEKLKSFRSPQPEIGAAGPEGCIV